jgi:hypothetical protein
MRMGVFNTGGVVARSTALGVFVKGSQRPQGMPPLRPGRKIGLGTVPALQGLFSGGGRARVVGISQVATMATDIWRGSV